MDLKQLRYFTVLATQQHFGRAANILHIAQPALTRQIQALEEELGVTLFTRHARGATPTEEAAILLDRGSFLLRYAEQLKQDIRAKQLEPQGPVVLGLASSVAIHVAAPLAEAVRERCPSVHLQLIEGFSDDMYAQVVQGKIDLALLNGNKRLPELVATPLVRERICLLCTAGDRRVRGNSVRIEDLAPLPLVLPGVAKSGVRLQLELAAANAGVDLNVVVEVQSTEVAMRMVAEGLGLAVQFAAPIRADILAGRFRALPIEGLYLERHLARSSSWPVSRATAAIEEILCELIRRLVSSGMWPHATLL